MCGICGKVDLRGRRVDPAEVRRMCATLVHRGPDAEGVHAAEWFGLGQRRLAIIDLHDRAVAPLANPRVSLAPGGRNG